MRIFTRLMISSGISLAGLAMGATMIEGFSPAVNDRFADDAAEFIGAANDFSGIGRDAGGRWVTMLSSRVLISANHLAPGGTVTFYPGNDPLATPVTETISEGERIGTTDLWIGRLANALPASIASYGFSTTVLTEANFGTSALAGAFIFMGGISPTGSGYGASPLTNQTVGSNRLEGFSGDVLVPSAADALGDILITVRNEAGDTSFGFSTTPSEAQLAGGDSGSPLLLVSGDDLIVAGIALGIGTVALDEEETEIREASAFTYTGSYAAEIQAYLNATPVPEISPLALACLGLGLIRRRR